METSKAFEVSLLFLLSTMTTFFIFVFVEYFVENLLSVIVATICISLMLDKPKTRIENWLYTLLTGKEPNEDNTT